MHLPEITEIKRLRIEPGDAFVVRTESREITAEAAQMIRERIRGTLGLPNDFPVLILSAEIDVEVVNRGSG